MSKPIPEKLLCELEKAGFKIGTIKDMLDLSAEDMEIIELRLVIHRLIKEVRTLMKERDKARVERDQMQQNYANAIGPR